MAGPSWAERLWSATLTILHPKPQPMALLISDLENVPRIGKKERLMHLNVAGLNRPRLAGTSGQLQQSVLNAEAAT